MDMCRVKYYLVSRLSEKQVDFIVDNIYCSTDGTYEIDRDNYRELRDKHTGNESLRDLFRTLGKEISKGKGHFSFRIFY